mgnify:CR=1 FL=1
MSKDHTTNDVAFIKALAELLNENDLSEISVKREYGENDALNVKVSKHAPAPQYAPMHYAPAPAAAPAPAPAAAPAAPSAAGAAKSEDPAEHPGAVTSPMVGTVYLRPSPEADQFKKAGDSVKEGETILLVEAMKTFNPITAPKSGTLTELLVDDAQPVEYGEALFIIS